MEAAYVVVTSIGITGRGLMVAKVCTGMVLISIGDAIVWSGGRSTATTALVDHQGVVNVVAAAVVVVVVVVHAAVIVILFFFGRKKVMIVSALLIFMNRGRRGRSPHITIAIICNHGFTTAAY